MNEKYADVRSDIFFLFHRSRRWNPQEGVWMGYERKRGKLADLNATLRGAQGRFADVVGETAILQKVRYVITLDTDTQLPRDAARRMVGTLAHRLNRPVYDASRHRVIEGYTILQPRVDVSFPSALRSRFVQLYGGDPGVDPYTRVVSDVYQDLFGEGSFIGKGIYDVDSFERQCADFPENAILSHDLIEGAYARSGLLSDVTLYEEHPSRYATDIDRRHRWMRGDWQIAGWLLPWVRGRSGRLVRNPISALSRWKILDNLRRSMTPMAMLLVLLLSWAVSPAVAAAALVFLGVVVLLPTMLAAAADLFYKPVDLPLHLHLRTTLRSLIRPLAQNVLTFVFLPYEAYISFDAIARTLVRMGWTRRRLLEWKTHRAHAQSIAQRAGRPENRLGRALVVPSCQPRRLRRCHRRSAEEDRSGNFRFRLSYRVAEDHCPRHRRPRRNRRLPTPGRRLPAVPRRAAGGAVRRLPARPRRLSRRGLPLPHQDRRPGRRRLVRGRGGVRAERLAAVRPSELPSSSAQSRLSSRADETAQEGCRRSRIGGPERQRQEDADAPSRPAAPSLRDVAARRLEPAGREYRLSSFAEYGWGRRRGDQDVDAPVPRHRGAGH